MERAVLKSFLEKTTISREDITNLELQLQDNFITKEYPLNFFTNVKSTIGMEEAIYLVQSRLEKLPVEEVYSVTDMIQHVNLIKQKILDFDATLRLMVYFVNPTLLEYLSNEQHSMFYNKDVKHANENNIVDVRRMGYTDVMVNYPEYISLMIKTLHSDRNLVKADNVWRKLQEKLFMRKEADILSSYLPYVDFLKGLYINESYTYTENLTLQDVDSLPITTDFPNKEYTFLDLVDVGEKMRTGDLYFRSEYLRKLFDKAGSMEYILHVDKADRLGYTLDVWKEMSTKISSYLDYMEKDGFLLDIIQMVAGDADLGHPRYQHFA